MARQAREHLPGPADRVRRVRTAPYDGARRRPQRRSDHSRGAQWLLAAAGAGLAAGLLFAVAEFDRTSPPAERGGESAIGVTPPAELERPGQGYVGDREPRGDLVGVDDGLLVEPASPL